MDSPHNKVLVDDGEDHVVLQKTFRRTDSVTDLPENMQKAFYEQAHITFFVKPVLVPDEDNIVWIETFLPQRLTSDKTNKTLPDHEMTFALMWDSERGSLEQNLREYYPNLQRIVLTVSMVDQPPKNHEFDKQSANLRKFLWPLLSSCDLMILLTDRRTEEEKALINWDLNLACQKIANLLIRFPAANGVMGVRKTDSEGVWNIPGGSREFVSWK